MTDLRDRRGVPDSAEDEVAALFRMAGPPATLSEEEIRPAREAAREAWRGQIRARAARRRVAAAVAAGLLAAAGLVWWGRERVQPAIDAPVASLQLRTGGVTIVPGSAAARGGRALHAGTVLASAVDGRIAIRLAGGASVRVDGASRLRLASARTLELERGALYVDTGPLPAPPIEVVTPLGRVTDLGTQFEVRLSAAGAGGAPRLRLRVREGEVTVQTETAAHRAAAGGELLLDAEGVARRAAVAADDPGWQWAARAAPQPEIEGQSLATFLDWATRELGLRWRLAEPLPPLAAEEIVLHGSVEGLTPEEAIEVVLTGSGLRAERAGGELLVSAAPPPRASSDPR
jgi:ferric-dicitrate binding protein FerR (iron transport regulator)